MELLGTQHKHAAGGMWRLSVRLFVTYLCSHLPGWSPPLPLPPLLPVVVTIDAYAHIR
jgi:hypothetical protein